MLDMTGLGEEVIKAGNSKSVNFTLHSHIFTRGLFTCFAVCAVWNKQGDTFRDGFLAHVSSPGPTTGPPRETNFHLAIKKIPSDAYVACGVGLQRDWGPFIAETIKRQQGVPDTNIWVYFRPDNNNQVGFGIDKHGRFGEVL